MLPLILCASLLSAAELPSAPAEIHRIIPLADISGGMIGDFFPLGAPDGVRDALLFMVHGGTILVTDLSLFEIDTANKTLKLQVAADDDKPVVFRTIYIDREGRTHEIVTDCKRYSTFKACAKAHGEALAAMEAVFPRKSVFIDFNELNPRWQDENGNVLLPGFVIRMLDVKH